VSVLGKKKAEAYMGQKPLYTWLGVRRLALSQLTATGGATHSGPSFAHKTPIFIINIMYGRN